MLHKRARSRAEALLIGHTRKRTYVCITRKLRFKIVKL